jgi:hypothetical protein
MKLEALAFALLIGGQFLATIVVSSKRAHLYFDAHQPQEDQARQEREPISPALHGKHPAEAA